VRADFFEESVFRGCLLPVLARTLGDVASVAATTMLFSAFHAPADLTHWIWFAATRCRLWMASFGLSDRYRRRLDLDACHLQPNGVSSFQALLTGQAIVKS
jgi:Type II CAAX prenyl endopeptidase Rce1-like